jgi:hypothetical protein
MGIQSFEMQVKIIGFAWKINNISESPFLPLRDRDKTAVVKTILRLLSIALECEYFIVNNL